MRMSRFDWSVCVVKTSIDPVLAVWFDSKAVKSTTAEHELTKFTVLNTVINTVIHYNNNLTGISLLKT